MEQLTTANAQENDDDAINNSFEDVCSEEPSSEEYDNEYGSEEYGDEDEDLRTKSPSPVKKQSIFDKLGEKPDTKPKKSRRVVINVHCTDYDVVPRVAKRDLNYKLKEFEEDHEGGVVNNERNQKL